MYDKFDYECPFGGDISNDCADCAYSCDYHFEMGECVRREEQQKKEGKDHGIIR